MTSRRKTEPSTTSKDSRANGGLIPPSPRTRRRTPQSSQRVQKPEYPRRASPRLQGRLLDTPSSLGLPQKPAVGCEEQVGTSQRKRRRGSEEPQLSTEKAAPAKRARNSASAVSDKSELLNANTLERHTQHEGYVGIFELIGLDSDNVRGRSKRSASKMGIGNSSATSTGTRDQETASQVTQKSSYTAAQYRLATLTDANIVFQFSRAPKEVYNRITAIIQRPVSKERKEELSRITHTLHDKFAPILDGASREDDCVELFHEALFALGYSDSLLLPRKADWESSLKPRVRLPVWNLNFLILPQDEAEDSLDRPSKRQHGEGTYPSPDTSGAAATGDTNLQDKGRGPEPIGPPPTPQWGVKTPRPDISIGLKDDAIVDTLQSENLTSTGAMTFLKALAAPNAQNGGKPLLCLGPTKQEVQIRFPFMPVEGKSYATGRTVYEAQNQAAVSGACALEILHRLDDLAQKAKPGSPKGQHIVFSVCTQGPSHELWAHYTTEKDGYRKYNSKIWKSCNMAVDCEIPGFLEAIDNVMRWGIGGHLEKIVNQLKLVLAAAPPSTCRIRFHRDNVLKHHQAVHKAHPTKRRRKPRRGALPKAQIQNNENDEQMKPLHSESSNENGIAFGAIEVQREIRHPLNGVMIRNGCSIVNPDLFNCFSTTFRESAFRLNVWAETASALQTPTQERATEACVLRYRTYILPRVPMIHETTLNSPCIPPELTLAMAALGGRRTPEFTGFSFTFFHEAVSLAEQSRTTNDLQKLQCQTLLIEFAIWADDPTLRQWAMQGFPVAITKALKILNRGPSDPLPGEWAQWIFEEEVKRTICALYSISIMTSFFLGHIPGLSASDIGLDLPCSDNLFHAPDFETWKWCRKLNHSCTGTGNGFANILRSLLVQTSGPQPCYHDVSIFGQHVLLCGILESLLALKKTPKNLLVSVIAELHSALLTWRKLWWASYEYLWNSGVSAFARIDNHMHLIHVRYLLASASPSTEGQALDLLLDVFEGLSKCGFEEVRVAAPVVFSRATYFCSLKFARETLKWLREIQHFERIENLSKRHQDLFVRIIDGLSRAPGRLSRLNDPSKIPIREAVEVYIEITNALMRSQQWMDGL